MSGSSYELENIIVRAGAGAGKTTELTKRVLGLAESYFAKNQKLPHFIVTTFTRKATQELRERLMKEALKRNSEQLVDFVQRPSCLHISTIHGVLSLFLSRYGASIGLSPQLKVISQVQEKVMVKKLIRSLTHTDENFNKKFQGLLESIEFSDLLSAFESYSELKLRHPKLSSASQEDFLAIIKDELTALKPQALEFIEQVRSQTDNEKWLVLADFVQNRVLPLCEGRASLNAVEEILESFPDARKTKEMSETLPELRKALKTSLEDLTGFALTQDFFDLHEQVATQFKYCADRIAEEILKQKLELGQLTMADLENLSLYLIHKDKNAAKAFAAEWDYWLIDEYQDTSPIQVEILKSLIQTTESFVVGDPQQSIYLFRGARSEVFSEQERNTKANGGKTLTLMTNYRSRPELLLFFNDIFTRISSQFQPMQPNPESKLGKAAEEEVAHIYILPKPEEDSRDLEIEAALQRCLELQNKGVSLEKICIIGRTNKNLDKIALKANEKGLPVQLHSSGDFFDRREVIDAMSFLKFLVNPHDNLNFLQVIRSPFFCIKDSEIAKFCHRDQESFWVRALKISKDPALLALSEALEKAHQVGIGEAWVQGLLKNAFFDLSHRIDPSGRREANLWKLITLVREEERKPGFSYLSFLRSKELLDTNTESGGESDAVPVVEPKRVNLMTVHASKGLQFEYVIIPHMGGGSQPAKSDFFMFEESSHKWTLSLPDPEEAKRTASVLGQKILEERREREALESERVFYVALTRAIMNVTLIWREDIDKKSWAAKVNLDLAEGAHATEKYKYKVFRNLDGSQFLVKEPEKTLPSKTKWVNSSPETFQMVSVTELLEKTEQKTYRASVDNSVESIRKAIKGVDVHKLLESYKYQVLRDGDFNWNSFNKTLSSDQQKAFSYVMSDRDGLWRQVIAKGEVEWGFSVMSPKGLLQGQIDLWGIDDKGVGYVVDYKTGSPTHKEKAFKQLQIYSWALQKMKKLDSVKEIQLVVIYPYSGITEVRVSPSLAELQREIELKVTAIDSSQDT